MGKWMSAEIFVGVRKRSWTAMLVGMERGNV